MMGLIMIANVNSKTIYSYFLSFHLECHHSCATCKGANDFDCTSCPSLVSSLRDDNSDKVNGGTCPCT